MGCRLDPLKLWALPIQPCVVMMTGRVFRQRGFALEGSDFARDQRLEGVELLSKKNVSVFGAIYLLMFSLFTLH